MTDETHGQNETTEGCGEASELGSVLDAKPPTLYDMRNKELSCAELQLALVHLIDLYNKQGKEVAAAITELRRYRDSRRDFDIMNTPYGI